MKPDLIDDIINTIQSSLPPGLGAVQADLRQALHLKLQELFASQGLVTQESFEIQRQVLLRTREKLEALEARISALEH